MPLLRLGIKKPIAIGLAILLSLGIRPSKSEANPAMLLAPELCATGIGCVVGAVIVVGGVAYIIQQRNGHKVLIPKDTGVTYSRPLSGIEAAKMGDAHWAREVTDCYKIGKRIGKKPKAHYPASGSEKGRVDPRQKRTTLHFWAVNSGTS
ncbi:MAG: hypothetical protein DSM106950_13600 [Stigonema ocellatum SAG 48.90 = DSM 106950]|nr:hypothetical protein [Stigonema ocellatum SAG 48.90 = DSM 106950]